MNVKRFLVVFMILCSLACNFVTKAYTAESTRTPLSAISLSSAGQNIYIPPQCQNMAVATVPAATALAYPTPFLEPNPEISITLQKQLFESVVKKVNEVYVYRDFNGLDWRSITESYRTKINAGLTTEEFYTNMYFFINELGDEHSYFSSPSDVAFMEAAFEGAGEYVGVGFYVLPTIPVNHISVLYILPDSPAEHSGLRPHDIILAVDGHPVVQDGMERSWSVLGEECSAVVLTVQSPGEAARDVIMLRQKLPAQSIIQAELLPTSDGSHIGYISLPTFFEQSIPDQVADALRQFGRLDGLILDNRFNGGGSSEILEPILAYFTSGSLGQFESRDEVFPLGVIPDPIHNSQTVPLVILVGEHTASFGEIFSGALRDVGRAQIVGQPSLGNVEILNGYRFKDGSELWIAEATFIPIHSQADWEQTGIVPDVIAYADWDTFTFETDPSILAAIKLLGH
jgi:carboxyl-terminal processing protease